MNVARGVPHISACFCTFMHVSPPFLDHLEWIWGNGIVGCIAAVLLLVALGQRTWSGVLTVPG